MTTASNNNGFPVLKNDGSPFFFYFVLLYFSLPFSPDPLANENDECNWHRMVVLFLIAEWFYSETDTPIKLTPHRLISRYESFYHPGEEIKT
jgi:hypothetical protein